jgi:hypothetical protein
MVYFSSFGQALKGVLNVAIVMDFIKIFENPKSP